MDIYIDGQKADVILEDETNLYEVASGIERWARSAGRFLRRLQADDRSWFGVDESLKEVPLEGIRELRFETVLPHELALEALEDVATFLQRLAGLPDGRWASASDLPETLRWCSQVIAKSRTILGLDLSEPVPGRGTTVAEWLGRLERAAEAMLRSEPSSFASFRSEIDPETGLDAVRLLIERGRRRPASAATPSREEVLRNIAAARLELSATAERVTSIAERLHTGKDQEAMNDLTAVSSSLTAVIRTLQQADPFLPAGFSGLRLEEQGPSVAEELGRLTDIFKEIASAFDQRDIVLLCDLLEYELRPRLDTLDRILGLLESRINAGFN